MTPALQSWEAPPAGRLADAANATAATLPRIETARLVLRAPRIEDFDSYAGIYLSDRWFHDEPQGRWDTWLDFCQLVAGWVLRGAGVLSIERREDGALIGFVIVNHEFGDPEMELGWMLTAEAEGHGYATEAASAFRAYAQTRLGVAELVSYIAHGNVRSHRVAERLGARRDEVAEAHPAIAGDVRVYRHPVPA